MEKSGGLEAWQRPVFVAGGRTITAGEVVLAADCRGDLGPVWRRLRQQIALEARASGLDAPVEDARLQSMSEQFRYERDLITAEETERWLEERGLTLDDFNAYLQRRYRAEAAEESDPSGDDRPVAADVLWPLLLPELWFSGDLERMAVRLSWSIAAAAASAGSPPARADFRRDAGSGPTDAVAWPAAFDDQDWRNQVDVYEAAYRRERERLAASDQPARHLKALRLALTRVDLEIVDADSLDAARELMMCVREDGRPLAEVAAEAGYPYEQTTCFHEDLIESLQRQLVSAATGEMLAPLEEEGRVRLVRLAAKTEPDADDSEVRDRLNHRIVERHFSELSTSCVQWVLGPAVAP